MEGAAGVRRARRLGSAASAIGEREAAPGARIREENGIEIRYVARPVTEQLRKAGPIVDLKAAPALIEIEPYELHVVVAGVTEDGFELPLERFSPELGRGTEIAHRGAAQVQRLSHDVRGVERSPQGAGRRR